MASSNTGTSFPIKRYTQHSVTGSHLAVSLRAWRGKNTVSTTKTRERAFLPRFYWWFRAWARSHDRLFPHGNASRRASKIKIFAGSEKSSTIRLTRQHEYGLRSDRLADMPTLIGENVYALKIDFQRDSPNPSRVFRAMSALIEAFTNLD